MSGKETQLDFRKLSCLVGDILLIMAVGRDLISITIDLVLVADEFDARSTESSRFKRQSIHDCLTYRAMAK